MLTRSPIKGFALACAVAALEGCGAQQIQHDRQAVIPAALFPAHSRSYMMPEAKSTDLLYVSLTQSNDVEVFTYPRGKLVGILTGFSGLQFLCSDASGNVWIPNSGSGTIVEYPHGGSQPIATLQVPSTVAPGACSVDPSTGDLAVAGDHGAFAVYKHGEGTPRIHRVNFFAYSVAYDSHGNLFVDGREYGNPFVLGELPAGSRHFRELLVDPHLDFFDQIQWDGQFVDVSVYEFIYRYSVAGKKVKLASTVGLSGVKYVGGFWIHGSKIVATDEAGDGQYPTAEIYSWPAGGSPTKEIPGTAGWGVTVSVAGDVNRR